MAVDHEYADRVDAAAALLRENIARDKKRIRDQEELIEQLRRDLHDARLALLNSDTLRAALHNATVDTAKSMSRALALTEVAYYAGHERGRVTGDIATAEPGYREWVETLKERV